MAADRVLPGPAKPVPAEIVHYSGRTGVTRLVVAGGTVIRKEPPPSPAMTASMVIFPGTAP